MKQAIIGLRKRETYDELINDLDHDLIKNYPDRRASELENSSYMSQLRGSFEEMLMQNDNLMKEKQKEMLLHEQAGQANVGRHELSIDEGRWRPHVTPEPEEIFHTPDRPAPPQPPPESARPRRFEAAGEQTTLEPVFRFAANDLVVKERVARIPRMPKHYEPQQPPIQVSSTTQGPEIFNIGEKKTRQDKSRSTQRRKKRDERMSHDVDPAIEEAHQIAIDDEEMHQQRQEELREQSVVMHRMMLEAAQNPGIENFTDLQKEKRKEEEVTFFGCLKI